MKIINKLNAPFVTFDKEYRVLTVDVFYPEEITIEDDEGNEISLTAGEYEIVDEPLTTGN